VIYECHVKGLTMRHPEVPPHERGTYLGLSADPVTAHLRALGVTAVELLPVQHFVADRVLVERGLTNYWGYNTIGFFAPDVRYATAGRGQQVAEFKTMVKRLHRAGLEVILDVVYNHTGEGNHLGPMLAFRGLDNASYYRLQPDDLRYHVDFTGCGNTLDVRRPRVLQLILDSLRYWVTDMHVDGFRFDLAPVLARGTDAFDPLARVFEIIAQDPVLSQVKLIAEPWDLGPDGHRLGGFPPGWAEWNGRYRDAVRRFWRGDASALPELASRVSGSSDMFDRPGRGPFASINLITCHDGFTLRDLVSYESKHNEANGEANRDGRDHELSRNWGVEGPADQERLVRLRERLMRNFLATLAFSQGVPMLSQGDEVGRTQHGNNNAYCQDNETSWLDWEHGPVERTLLQFTRRVFALRSENPVLRRRRHFRGQVIVPSGVKDVTWLHPDGREITADDWRTAGAHTLGMLVHASATDERDERGRLAGGETILLLLNGGGRSRRFVLPRLAEPGTWIEALNTARDRSHSVMGDAVNLLPHSLILLRHGDVP
jgi:glycogen operon protein